MNDGDVFRKSDVGREEIKSQSLGVLPREARTLLIMIDGKRTYQNYLDTLDNSKMFADFGGVAPLFELLLELECIEVANTTNTRARIKTEPQASSSTQVPETLRSQSTQNSFDTSTETEFDRTFNSKSPSSVIDAGKKSLGGIFKSKVSDSNYGTIKSDLATYIEKNAPPAEAWGYLLSLEQCNDSSQLLRLAQEIQKSSNANLSRGMNEFIKRAQ